MKTVAFFNNKGGVGKTSLTYHLAYMFARLGYTTVAVDLDPQANLTAAFFDEEKLEEFWEDSSQSVYGCVDPMVQGTGDINFPKPLQVAERLSVVAGDLALSQFEDRLSLAWPGCMTQNPADLRATSAFHRIIRRASKKAQASLALVDVGPNLGAMNRAALLAADNVVVPLAADLFSLQGLRNLGPTLRRWRREWKKVLEEAQVGFPLPKGRMRPAGYVILRHAVRLDRPAKQFARWADQIPEVYRSSVLGQTEDDGVDHCLARIRNYNSLMPMSQAARKPMFDLKSADGALGSHARLVATCYDDFKALAEAIAKRCNLEKQSSEPSVGE